MRTVIKRLDRDVGARLLAQVGAAARADAWLKDFITGCVVWTVALRMEERIDQRYADVRRYQKALEEEKYAVLNALGARLSSLSR